MLAPNDSCALVLRAFALVLRVFERVLRVCVHMRPRNRLYENGEAAAIAKNAPKNARLAFLCYETPNGHKFM